MKYCHQCGHPNEDHTQYCERDGAQLESLDTSYKFDMPPGAFCTGCGQSREAHHVYCSTCGHHALEPAIGINRVEESLKSVAATGTQVFSQIKQAAKTKQMPSYKTLSQGFLVRPTSSGLLSGSYFGLAFLVVILLFAALLVSFIPEEVRSSLREVFGNEASSFKLTALVAVVLTANLFWTLDVERLLSFFDEMDAEAFDFLTRYPMILDAKVGSYFFALGGVILLLVLSILVFRGVTGREEKVGRFLGMLGSVSIGIFVLSLLSTALPFIESKWLVTAVTTVLGFMFAIGLGAFVGAKVEGVWKAAQQGARAILYVTVLSTVVGIGYYANEMGKITDIASDGQGYYVYEEGRKIGTIQGVLSNWQLIGHGGTQDVMLQTPVVSLKVGTSAFGMTVPKEVEQSVDSISDNMIDVEYMIDNLVEYGEFPREEYATTRELTTLSPSLIELVRQGAEASYANDELELERLYNEGIFSWFKVLVVVNILLYAIFAYRVADRKETLLAFVASPFLIYVVWQWFLGSGVDFTVGDRGVLDLSVSSMNASGIFTVLAVIFTGGAVGRIVNHYVKN